MLSIYSILPFFVIMALLWAVAEIIARTVPFYQRELAPQANRFDVLDGLRGPFAVTVLLTHATISYFYFRGHPWEPSPALFYSQIGQAGVICFFMITGFLFWSKAINANGKIRFMSLFWNRVRRLAPLYWFMSAIVIVLVLLETGLQINGELKYSINWLLDAITANILPLPGYFNGVNTVPINSGIVWTLRIEWGFYLLLPLTAPLATPRRVWFIAIPLFLMTAKWPAAILLVDFVFGMLAAHLVRAYDWRALMSKWWFAIVPLGALAAVTTRGPLPLLDPLAAVYVFIAFVAFIYGADLLGFLRTPGARLLSTISYSFYLLHGIGLYLVLNAVNKTHPITQLSDPAFWLIIACTGVVVVLVSSMTYVWIEDPFIHKKKPARIIPDPKLPEATPLAQPVG